MTLAFGTRRPSTSNEFGVPIDQPGKISVLAAAPGGVTLALYSRTSYQRRVMLNVCRTVAWTALDGGAMGLSKQVIECLDFLGRCVINVRVF